MSEAEINAELERLRPRLERFGKSAGFIRPLSKTGSTLSPQFARTKFNYIAYNAIGADQLNSNPDGNTRGIIVGTGETNIIEQNLISANAEDGILLSSSAENNTVRGNVIGLTNTGNAALGNKRGITIAGNRNQIRGNYVSGNLTDGIVIFPADGFPLPTENVLEVNHVGTNFSKDMKVPNLHSGIVVKGNRNKIGTTTVGNLVAGNDLNGISIESGSTENTVQGNYIGISTEATLSNGKAGIYVVGSGNTIGGTSAAARNVISGNLAGIVIGKISGSLPEDAKNNKVQGNYIGTNLDGTSAVPNTTNGIVLTGGANNNIIGGAIDNAGNFISGNGESGIRVTINTDSNPVAPFENKIQGNSIGLNAFHNAALPNENLGISIFNSPGNIIGGTETLSRNIICGNLLAGIAVKGGNSIGNTVRGNYVGVTTEGLELGNGTHGIEISESAQKTILLGNIIGANQQNGIFGQGIANNPIRNSAGLTSSILISGNLIGLFRNTDGSLTKVPNANGIVLEDVKNALIGVTDEASSNSKNIISGNYGTGILIQNETSSDNIINNSIIGTDENGTSGIGNDGEGVSIIDGSSNIVGGINLGNIIAGNGGSGIQVQGFDNQIVANKIGVARRNSLTVKLPNAIGVDINGAVQTTIGGTTDSVRNTISGNNGAGVRISNGLSNFVVNNLIGTDENGANDLGNTADGVLISEDSSLNQIGNQIPNTGNRIANNGGSGVRIDETAGQSNLVDPNAIFGNQGLGIDIGTIGHTPNDLHDADEGANRGQNYPTLTHQINSGNQLVINFKVDSAPANSDYGANGIYVEFFKADASGEGEIFLGFAHYTTADYNSGSPQMKQVILGDATVLGITASDKITATATDAQNNSSEFTPTLAPTAANVKISGRIMTVSGESISNARVYLTDTGGQERVVSANPFGYFQFTEIASGQTYIIGVQHKRYVFAPQVITVNEEITGLNFTPLP